MIAPLLDTSAGETAASLVAALVVGGAFGWTLERAGLGSARKLSAQFRLADFTVVKVMFSAIVTAMLGLHWLARAGLLDVERLAVPPTFVAPQLVGGLVFGIGFALAGLCPGTACVAGAAGRIDGVAAVMGLIAGTTVFELARPALGALPDATPRGTLRLPELLGIDEGIAVALIAAAALALFALVARLERRRGVTEDAGTTRRTRMGLVLASAALSLGAAMPTFDASRDPMTLARAVEREEDHVTALELARWIRAGKPGLRVVDVRAESAFAEYRIPGAERATLDSLLRERPRRGETLVLYSEGGTHAAQGWVLLRASGRRDVYVLRGGLYEWITDVIDATLPADADSARRAAWPEVSALSRWFGGMPRVGVGQPALSLSKGGAWGVEGQVPSPSGTPSSIVPIATPNTPGSTAEIVRNVRRRGC